jgi:hypothetical protein
MLDEDRVEGGGAAWGCREGRVGVLRSPLSVFLCDIVGFIRYWRYFA